MYDNSERFSYANYAFFMTGLEKDFQVWKEALLKSIMKLLGPSNNVSDCSCQLQEEKTESIKCCKKSGSHASENGTGNMYESSSDESEDILDLEDMGGAVRQGRDKSSEVGSDGTTREMVTPLIRQSLTKQGKLFFTE